MPLPRLQNATDCGVLGGSRIVGGEEVVENEYPWMCSILTKDLSVSKHWSSHNSVKSHILVLRLWSFSHEL